MIKDLFMYATCMTAFFCRLSERKSKIEALIDALLDYCLLLKVIRV